MDKGNSPNGKASGFAEAKNVVRSLAKGFRILEAFSPHDAEMTLSQIATRTNLDAGTTFRLINTLVLTGYLKQVAGAKRYRLSLKVLDLGFSTIGSMEIGRSARPILRSLIDNVVHTASLDVLDGTDTVRIERVFKNVHKSSDNHGLGSRVPVVGTVIGDAIMAYLPRTQLSDLLETLEGCFLTPAALADFQNTLAQVRTLGYAHRSGEVNDSDHMIAAPSLDADGYPRAAISVACPNIVCSEQAFTRHSARRVVHAAKTLGRLFSVAGSLPHSELNKTTVKKPGS